MWYPLSVVVLSSILQSTYAAPKEELVTDLPGLSSQPPFKQYSGYLKGDNVGDKYLHYWFVESSSNPSTDPVVLWMNGGPGCSSDLGFLTEHGPFSIQSDGRTLKYNPYSWNQAANMIYLDSPAGVGYSYSLSKTYTTNDSAVAIQNAFAMKDFFKKFPEFKDNDFYITGESYAGIYVPTLASEILKVSSIKLKGFAVGNGLSSNDDNDNSLIYFAYYHGLIGEDDWMYLLKNCCPENGPTRCDFAKSECPMLYTVINLVWSSGLDVYNLYKKCDGGVASPGLSVHYVKTEDKYVTTYFGWPFSSFEKDHVEKLKDIPEDKLKLSPPCLNLTSPTYFLNSLDVRKSLHISPHAEQWEACSAKVRYGYRKMYTTVSSFYEKALSHKLRILVYNGDVDMACNFLGDEWFVEKLALKNPHPRKMWYYKEEDGTKQVAGFVKVFDQLSLVTVKGSGHMVPTDKPRPALEMFINFIQDRPFDV